MEDLYKQLAEKMRERPETNHRDLKGSWVRKYLSSPAGQFQLSWGAGGGPFLVQLRPGDHADFWVAPGGGQGRYDDDGHPGQHVRPVTGAEMAAILSAAPLPQPDSVYGYFALPGSPPSALAYWQEPQKVPNEPLRFSSFTLAAPGGGTIAEDAAKLWPFVDAGHVRCLDEAVASGKSTLTVEFDGKDYFRLVLDGQDYLPIRRVPGLTVRAEDLKNLSMVRMATRCVQERAAAAAALRAL